MTLRDVSFRLTLLMFQSAVYTLDARCPQTRPYLLNDKCISQCPPSAPMMAPENVYIHDGKIYCRKSCPEIMYRHGNRCMDECPDKTVPVRNTMECYNGTKCPPFYPINETIFCSKGCCTANCPLGFFELESNKTCILTFLCKKFVHASKCLDSCPPNYYSRSAASLDNDNPIAVSSIIRYRICDSDNGYRTTVVVCFTLAGILLPLIWYFFLHELLCIVTCRRKDIQKYEPLPTNIQNIKTSVLEDETPV